MIKNNMIKYEVTVEEFSGFTRTEWRVDGKLHRLDGPAVEWSDGRKEWWVEGERHCLDGPAVEWSDGSKAYWVEGKCHRLDGPAIERSNGNKEYYVEGKLHRLDGPAVEYSDGDKWYYVEGIQLSEEEFLLKTQPTKKMTVSEIEEKFGFKVEIVSEQEIK